MVFIVYTTSERDINSERGSVSDFERVIKERNTFLIVMIFLIKEGFGRSVKRGEKG